MINNGIKHFYVWTDQRKELDDLIQNHSEIKKILIFWCEENNIGSFAWFFEEVIEFSKKYDIPVTLITSFSEKYQGTNDNIKYITDNIQVIEWVLYFLHWTKLGVGDNSKNLENDNNLYSPYKEVSFEYPYTTLMYKTKFHRCALIDELAKHNLIERGLVSYHDKISPGEELGSVILQYPYKFYKPRRIILDQESTGMNLSIVPKQYQKIFFQIVAESDIQKFFFTEKTATPLFFRKPFLVLGCKNFHSILKEDFGFQLYEEIFDYSFDRYDSYEERAEGIVNNLLEIINLNPIQLKELYTKIFYKLEYNRKLSFELSSTKIPNNVKKFIEDNNDSDAVNSIKTQIETTNQKYLKYNT